MLANSTIVFPAPPKEISPPSYSERFNVFLKNNNWLETQYCAFFGKTYSCLTSKYPFIDKIAFVVNHILRLYPMIKAAENLPFSKATNCALMGAGALFYRLTAEVPCPRKFALASCAGAASFIFAKTYQFSPQALIPFGFYGAGILYGAYHSSPLKTPCCNSKTNYDHVS